MELERTLPPLGVGRVIPLGELAPGSTFDSGVPCRLQRWDPERDGHFARAVTLRDGYEVRVDAREFVFTPGSAELANRAA